VPLKISLSETGCRRDDVRHGIAEVRGALRIGVAGDKQRHSRVWHRAARALDSVAVQRLPVSDIASVGPLDLLLVAGWKGDAAEAITAHLQRGSGVVLQPGDGLDPTTAAAWFGAPAPSRGAAARQGGS
jgi:hypothetical protein